MIKFYYIYILCLILSIPLNAQVIKNVNISNEHSYSDHISLKTDDSDSDFIVKFIFNEEENTLTVSLISYRMLFGFEDYVRYGSIINFTKLNPLKLSYVTKEEPNTKFKVSSLFRRLISSKSGYNRKYIFSPWIKYEGLQLQPVEFSMVNEFIERKFDIINKQVPVSITLGDILVMDKSSNNKNENYLFDYISTLNRVYKITIDRNPCFGRNKEIDYYNQKLSTIQSGFDIIIKLYNSPSLSSSTERINEFYTLKQSLLESYKIEKDSSSCSIINNYIDSCNTIINKIKQLECDYEPTIISQHIDCDFLLNSARNIDTKVARWEFITGYAEREDIVESCLEIINAANEHILSSISISEEMDRAIEIFYSAQNMFYNNCGF